MKKRTLVIVDFQNDFCNPNGSLYVKGAETAKANIIAYLKSSNPENVTVILTRDWHNEDDKSFKCNGGIWPNHCVAGTWGAEVDKDIIEVLEAKGFNYMYSNKGTYSTIEEYGAFSTIYETNEGVVVKNVNDSYETLIVDKTVDVWGIAGDFCVYETTKNLKKSQLVGMRVLFDCTASIDCVTKIKEYANAL